MKALKTFFKALAGFNWVQTFLYWAVCSAGKVAECLFLFASIWMSLNANVHAFIISISSEQITERLSWLATTAYVGLPVAVLPLACVTTIGHFRTYLYDRSLKSSLAWALAYSFPTVIFFGLDLVTVGCSVASIDFQMPVALVVLRALAGFFFAFISLLYHFIGKEQERERLKEKDEVAQALRQDHAKAMDKAKKEMGELQETLSREMERLTMESQLQLRQLKLEKDGNASQIQADAERKAALLHEENQRLSWQLAEQRQEVERMKRALSELESEVNRSDEEALQAYSPECIAWLKNEETSATIEEIAQYTGHTIRKVRNAFEAGKLVRTRKDSERIRKTSVVEWLKNNLPSSGFREQDTGPMLHAVR